MEQRLLNMRQQAALFEKKLEAQRPDRKLMEHRLVYERLEHRLIQAMKEKYTDRQQKFIRYVDKLSGLSPTSRLRGGYVFAQTKEGQPIVSVKQIEEGHSFFVTQPPYLGILLKCLLESH